MNLRLNGDDAYIETEKDPYSMSSIPRDVPTVSEGSGYSFNPKRLKEMEKEAIEKNKNVVSIINKLNAQKKKEDARLRANENEYRAKIAKEQNKNIVNKNDLLLEEAFVRSSTADFNALYVNDLVGDAGLTHYGDKYSTDFERVVAAKFVIPVVGNVPLDMDSLENKKKRGENMNGIFDDIGSAVSGAWDKFIDTTAQDEAEKLMAQVIGVKPPTQTPPPTQPIYMVPPKTGSPVGIPTTIGASTLNTKTLVIAGAALLAVTGLVLFMTRKK